MKIILYSFMIFIDIIIIAYLRVEYELYKNDKEEILKSVSDNRTNCN